MKTLILSTEFSKIGKKIRTGEGKNTKLRSQERAGALRGTGRELEHRDGLGPREHLGADECDHGLGFLGHGFRAQICGLTRLTRRGRTYYHGYGIPADQQRGLRT